MYMCITNLHIYDAASQVPPQRVWVYRYRAMGIQELCSPTPPVGGWGCGYIYIYMCIIYVYISKYIYICVNMYVYV